MSKTSKKQIHKILLGTCTLLFAYFLGIYTAKTSWYCDKFTPKSIPDEIVSADKLELKSLEPYNKAYFELAETQYDRNLTSQSRYEYFHNYYEKVVQRIKDTDFGDKIVSNEILDYISGYSNRKAEIEFVLFPCKDKPLTDCGYGTKLGSVYPQAMLEFDRQELLMYKMILSNMYIPLSEQQINKIFEE